MANEIYSPSKADEEQATTQNATSATQTDVNHHQADQTRLFMSKNTQRPTEYPSVEPGTLLQNRYLIEKSLGSGGISHVYKARDILLEHADVKDAVVAIKILQKHFIDQPDALQLLLQEARKTQQLSHPNIIRLIDVGKEGDHYFLVMEYLDGETLEEIINRYKPNGLPFKSALNLLTQIANGLEYAHQNGIIHADLKPANVMVDNKGNVKLLDFGVAHKLHLNVDVYAAEQPTALAPINGYTPAYASHEILSGHSPTPSDDVYSFACLAYELLTSKHPYDRYPANTAKTEKLQVKKPKHTNLIHWRALQKGLALDKNNRQESIGQFMRHFGRPLTPLMVGGAVGIALIISLASIFSNQQHNINQLQQQLTQLDGQLSYQNNLQFLTPPEVLQKLDSFSEMDPIIFNGVLRYHSESIIKHFESQIDNLLSASNNRYPDYVTLEKVLFSAATLFPDSHQLAGIRNRINRSKLSSIEVLENQLQSLLLAKRYNKNEQQQNAFIILSDLQHIEPGYQPRLSSDVVNLFLQEYQTALESMDAIKLQELIQVGEAVFSAEPAVASILTHTEEMKLAIVKLADYKTSLNTGSRVDFPYQEADIFYRSTFDFLNQQLSQSERVTEIDHVYEQWQELSKILPNDFDAGVRLRRQLADQYLKLSGEMLQSQQVRGAERLMRRANELMVSISS